MQYQIETFEQNGDQKAEMCAEYYGHYIGEKLRIYVCDRWVCQSIDLTKEKVTGLIAALTEMKEAMHD